MKCWDRRHFFKVKNSNIFRSYPSYRRMSRDNIVENILTYLVIVEGRGIALSLDGGLMNDPIQLVSGDAHGHRCRGLVQHLATQTAGHTQICGKTTKINRSKLILRHFFITKSTAKRTNPSPSHPRWIRCYITSFQ